MRRCGWTGDNPLLVAYHDTEWGDPVHEDRTHFEYLALEVMQCGLSWLTILKKRDARCLAFDRFDYERIASYGERDIQRLMEYEGIIHSRKKIEAIIKNARVFMEIQREFGSFDTFIWSFTDGKTVEYPGHADGTDIPARNGLSDQISGELKKRGCSFLGSITIYSHLQAAGIINDHNAYCYKYVCRLQR